MTGTATAYDFRSGLNAICKDINKWRLKSFKQFEDPDVELLMTVGGVLEEAGELMRAVRKQVQGIRGTHDEWHQEQRKEAGDVFISLCNMAGEAGFDLAEAILERWEEVSNRDVNHDPIGSKK